MQTQKTVVVEIERLPSSVDTASTDTIMDEIEMMEIAGMYDSEILTDSDSDSYIFGGW